MKQFKYIFLIALICVLIAGCFFQHFYISDLTGKLLTIAENLAEKVREDDLSGAEMPLAEFTEYWNMHRSRLFSLLEHDIVQEVESELAAFREDLLNQNRQQLYSETARLIQALRAMAQLEELKLYNIF